MSPVRALRYLYLAYFSAPRHDRLLYRHVRRQRVQRILELGLGNTERACRLIEIAAQASGQRVSYTGIDLFELRGEQAEGVSLKLAHRRLSATGARVRLVPGDPHSAMAAVANCLAGTELVIVSADQDRQALAKAWFYVPRVLAPTAAVFVEEPTAGGLVLRRLPADELARLAAPPSRRRAA
ncbi:MAG TPA: hypothetical protein VHV55_03405 [Pirellulales bacterium]|jgi:hypothetical protein|nr:hypothetical protein [Pirellulales bacterium]